jgi:hypothetical protein
VLFRRALAVSLLAVAVAATAHAFAATGSAAAFRASVRSLSPELADRMRGVSWRPGCPVPLRDLRAVSVSHRGFDGRTRQGLLIAHADAAPPLVRVFRRLYDARFPIRRLVPVDAYGGSDFRSIEADNTSAFNCRRVDGTTRWSRHAYGRAIDVNPIENPYVTAAGTTSHPASEPFLRRRPARAGMAVEGGVLVRAFDAEGWGWGGRWSGVKDYQHFSGDGR